MSGAESDIMMQPFKYLPVLLTLITIGIIIFAIIPSPNLAVDSMFNDICSTTGGIGLLNDLSYDASTSLIQFMVSDEARMSFTYPRNTYLVLSSLFDEEENLLAAVNLYQGLYNSRSNYRFLESCTEAACFCVVRTEMSFYTYKDLDYTACFPRLYAYTRASFDDYINGLVYENGDTDLIIFKESVDYVLSTLDPEVEEEEGILECFNWFTMYDYDTSGAGGQYFTTFNYDSNYMSYSILAEDSDEPLYNALTSFYELTKGAFITEVSTCASIPSDNTCFCPYISQFMTAGVDEGVFLGISGSYTSVGFPLDIDTLVYELDVNPDSCLIRLEPLSDEFRGRNSYS